MGLDGIEWQSMSTASPKPLPPRQQRAQRGVIGRVEAVDALERRNHGQRRAVDLVGFRDDAGDGAEPAHHAHRLGIGVMGEAVAEQRRIELVGLAVDVEISAREMGIEQGGAHVGHEAEQLLHIGVLGAPQRQGIEPRGREKGAWIDPAAMGRVEKEGRRQRGRPGHLEGWRKLGLDRLRLAWLI